MIINTDIVLMITEITGCIGIIMFTIGDIMSDNKKKHADIIINISISVLMIAVVTAIIELV